MFHWLKWRAVISIISSQPTTWTKNHKPHVFWLVFFWQQKHGLHMSHIGLMKAWKMMVSSCEFDPLWRKKNVYFSTNLTDQLAPAVGSVWFKHWWHVLMFPCASFQILSLKFRTKRPIAWECVVNKFVDDHLRLKKQKHQKTLLLLL